MSYAKLLLLMLLGFTNPAITQADMSRSYISLSIGINLPVYPHLVPVPGYPVYYAPQLRANYFFYDGLYWVFLDDGWYVSDWYNGPWQYVDPMDVPLFILRIPVRYYLYPPAYFHGWRLDAPPRWGQRWGQRWGHDWEQHRHGWDHWDRHTISPRAPLPVYQQHYNGNRYPQLQQQRELQQQHYQYQPRDQAVRQRYQQQQPLIPPAQPQRYNPPAAKQPLTVVPVPHQQPIATPQREQEKQRMQTRESMPTPKAHPPQERKEQGREHEAPQQKAPADAHMP